MRHARAYIGTSGWNYRHWRGIFYPEEFREADWLGFYARHFDCAEANSTFYRNPSLRSIENWISQTPAGFRLAIKLWRGITQYRKLRNCREFLEIFFRSVAAVPKRNRGPILVQLPPSQGRDLPKLDAFLDELRDVTGPDRWKVAVEFRHDGWLCDETWRLLDRQRAAICLHDMAGRGAADEPNDASFVYLRRHGAAGKYAGSYPRGQLRRDAARIRRWCDAGRTVYAFFNNDIGGYAIENARTLREML